MARASDNAATLIEVSGLCHRYAAASRHALKQVDFHVAKASLVGLLGPNGAGKTTLLNILNGVTRVQAGRVRVAGHAPGVGGRLAANSSLVPQSCAFYADLTVRENLAFLAGVHGLGATQWRSRLAHCVAVPA